MRIGPKFKIARRLGERIFPKTQTTKFTLSGTERKTKGKKSRGTVSEYGAQLIEKQKARYTYGVTEKQFSTYVKKATITGGSNPAARIYTGLETRLDNVVFRLGLAVSRALARQMVSHGHIMLNGRRLTIPSATVKVGDVISIRPQSVDKVLFKNLEERLQNTNTPNWLVFDQTKNQGTILSMPVLGEGESNLHFDKILEFYSRV